MSDKDEKVSKHDLYEKLWQSRDFEINHLWQRSIFLGTFIVIFFTVYFNLFKFYISAEGECPKSVPSCDMFIIIQSIVCLFGFCFAVLWVCMARGSKYMYENHEGGINDSHWNGFFTEGLSNDTKRDDYEDMLNSGFGKKIPRHGQLPMENFNNRLISLRGGLFSSSKINVFIGYIFMFAWVLLAMFNWLFLFFLETGKLSFLSCIKNLPCLLQLALMLFIFLCAWVVISYNVLSDNYLSFPAYLKIMLKSRFCFNLERNKVKWVYAFLNGNEQDEEIQKHVKKKLEEYSENGYDDFNKKASLLKAKNGKYKKSDIRIFLTHPVLNHVLEQSLMYRVSVPEKLKGSWQDEYYNQRIKLGENIIIDIQGIPYIERTYKDFSFFADTDWGKIKRTGKYTLGEDDKRIHIILKEMNQYDLYMTLCLMEDEKLEVSILFTKHQNGLSVFSSKGDINYRFELIKE